MINRKGGEERREGEGEEKRENKKLCSYGQSSSNALEERKQEKCKQTHKT